MKYFLIFILSFSSLFASEHRLLLSGFTIHEKSHKKNGGEYNGFNYGAGYEFTTFEHYNELYFATNITVIKDSHNKPQYTLSGSPNIRFKLSTNTAVSFGLAMFGMWKKDNFKKGVSEEEAEYDLLFGAAPLSSVYYKNFNVNFAYVPTISHDNIKTVGFAIMYFGWKF